jgi:uncharacterized protein (DUF1778 family)
MREVNKVKDERITFKISEGQKEFLQKEADKKDESLSQYIMSCIINKLASEDKILDFLNS